MKARTVEIKTKTISRCNGTHVWIFSQGNMDGKVPPGYTCSCGQMMAHYTICSECGSQKFEPIDLDNGRDRNV